jgi:hypothetical protein
MQVTVLETHHVNLELYEIANYLRIRHWQFIAPNFFSKAGISLNIETMGVQMSLDAIAKHYHCDSMTIYKAIKGVG